MWKCRPNPGCSRALQENYYLQEHLYSSGGLRVAGCVATHWSTYGPTGFNNWQTGRPGSLWSHPSLFNEEPPDLYALGTGSMGLFQYARWTVRPGHSVLTNNMGRWSVARTVGRSVVLHETSPMIPVTPISRGPHQGIERRKAHVHWADLSATSVNRLWDGRELTVFTGQLAKSICPLSQLF